MEGREGREEGGIREEGDKGGREGGRKERIRKGGTNMRGGGVEKRRISKGGWERGRELLYCYSKGCNNVTISFT